MGSTLTNLLSHIIFSTKDRQSLITDTIQDGLYNYLGGIIRGEKEILLAVGGMQDHIHLLAKFKADVSMSKMMKRIKGNSSHWINEQRLGAIHFSWQDGYGAFSVSQSQHKSVSQYILTQKEHHRKKTFQEEFLEFIKLQNIEYNEKYLWS